MKQEEITSDQKTRSKTPQILSEQQKQKLFQNLERSSSQEKKRHIIYEHKVESPIKTTLKSDSNENEYDINLIEINEQRFSDQGRLEHSNDKNETLRELKSNIQNLERNTVPQENLSNFLRRKSDKSNTSTLVDISKMDFKNSELI